MSVGSKKIAVHAGISVAIGILLSFLFALLYYVVHSLWIGPVNYNYSFSDIAGEQSLVLVYLMPVVAGIVVAIYCYRRIEGVHMLTGAILGLVAGIILGLLMIPVIYLTIIFSVPVMDVYGTLLGVIEGLLGQQETFVVIGISAIISSMCAFFYLYLLQSSENKGLKTEAQTRTALLVIAAFILAVALLPQLIAYITVNSGSIQESHSWYSVNVTAERAGNDSLIIGNAGGPDQHLLDPKTPFIITINGKNATDASAINGSGLLASVSPAYGLAPDQGASATFTGPDLISGENGTLIVVEGIFHDGRRQTLLIRNR